MRAVDRKQGIDKCWPYHTITNQVQALLTKPELSTLILTLIQPHNLKEKPKSQR